MKSSTLDAYYRAELLYAQVQAVLHLDDHDQHDAKAAKLGDLLLAVAHVDRTLRGASNDRDADVGVLGVTSPLLLRATGLNDDGVVQYHRDAARQALLPRVEENLRAKCNDVCDVVLPELLDRSSGPATVAQAPLARQVMEIPARILELQSLKAQRERRAELLKRQLRNQLSDDLARIKAMILTVHKLLEEYKQQDAPRVLQAKLQWLVAYSRAMSVRAQVLAKQVQVETYTPERTALLSGVHDALQERQRRALEEREQLHAKFHLYQSADAEYQELARTYARVLQGIDEKKKWIQSLNM